MSLVYPSAFAALASRTTDVGVGEERDDERAVLGWAGLSGDGRWWVKCGWR